MSPTLNPLVLDTGSPPIPQVQAWGQAYAGGRGPLIDLCQAVPGYPPHPALLEQLAAAAGDPVCAKYCPITGDPLLRQAYAAHLSSFYGGQVGADQVAITAGCNQAFFAAMLTLVERGGAVLLPTPWYFNHEMTCTMLGIEARALPCLAADGFVPDPDRAEALLGEGRARAVVLVTPNNPTGAIYPPETIARFHALCRRRGLWLVLDETYRDFLPPDQPAPHGLLRDPAWSETVVQLYSFSKSYAIPGHRLGAITASAALMPQLAKALDCLHICPQRPGQAALTWALEGGLDALSEWRSGNRAEMNRRAAVLREAFARCLPAWQVDALGTYFAYVRHPFRGVDAWRVVEHLALEHGVLLLPASAFAGSADHVRVSFANVSAPGIQALAERLSGVAAGAGALASAA
jgi:aspartate/methionine/tyrosine aminotransferase